MKKIALLIALSFSLAVHAEVKVDQPWVRGTIAEGCEKARTGAGRTRDDGKQAMGLAYR